MEVKSFQDSRNSELDSFQKRYRFLKSEYSSTLASAINETDANEQQKLVKRVQDINKQLTEELHGIIAILNKGSTGFNPKKLEDLTEELIKYQHDYAEIEKSNDKVTTLKMILHTTTERLKNATWMFYINVSLLGILGLYLFYLIFNTTFGKSVVKTIGTAGPT